MRVVAVWGYAWWVRPAPDQAGDDARATQRTFVVLLRSTMNADHPAQAAQGRAGLKKVAKPFE